MHQNLLWTSLLKSEGLELVILFFYFLAFCFLVWVAAGIFGMRKIKKQNDIIISILSRMAEQQGVDMKQINKQIRDEL
jgi:hypothetical protein